MSSEPERAQRAPLDQAVLTARMNAAPWPWPPVGFMTVTRSTNADIGDLASRGAAHGTVITTDFQSAGRGRLGRRWDAPLASSVMFSLLLRPYTSLDSVVGWVPLYVGVAVSEALSRVTKLPVTVKWPNDLLIEGRKIGGILVERSADQVIIVGVGINVSLTEAELPGPEATSLLLAGSATLVREDILAAVLVHLAAWWEEWQAANFDVPRSGLADAYTKACATLQQRVRVTQPNDEVILGRAVGIGTDGALLVVPDGAAADAPPLQIRAADVVHVRAE
jgi:BirA family biotin operon repressor/biotin-[acetyl-CoA-carboxylase] ligase